jgi:hypothetical protein
LFLLKVKGRVVSRAKVRAGRIRSIEPETFQLIT